MWQFENPQILWALWFLPLWSWLIFRLSWRDHSAFHTRSPITRALTTSLAFGLAIVAMARPQLGHSVKEQKSFRGNLLFAIDVSQSMMASDVYPSRLEFAVSAAQVLLKTIPESRVALYPFAADGYLLLPFTADIQALDNVITTLNPYTMSQQGTDFPTALQTLWDRIQYLEQKSGKLIEGLQVVLFSDGESHSPLTATTTRQFVNRNIPIHTVGVGTQSGASIKIFQTAVPVESFSADTGRVVTTKLHRDVLEQLSRKTGGEYFHPSLSEMGRLSQAVARRSTQYRASSRFVVQQEIYPWLLLLTIILLAFEVSLGRWQYVLRALPFLFLFPATSGAVSEAELRAGLERSKNASERSVFSYNLGVLLEEQGRKQEASEAFGEAARNSPSVEIRKKALFGLGNLSMKDQNPEMARQYYQQAYEQTDTNNSSRLVPLNKKISENIALASLVLQQMKTSGSEGTGEGDEMKREVRDPKKPSQFDKQTFSEARKNRILQVITSEEQQVLQRLQGNRNKSARTTSQKPW